MRLARGVEVASLSGPPCVVDLKSFWTIIIAGPAAELPKRLFKTHSEHRSIVLRSDAMREHDALSIDMLELLADTVVHREVGAIIVLGQSKDAAAWSQPSNGMPHGCRSGYSSMLKRVSGRMEDMRRAQNRVRVRLNQIRLHVAISPSVSLCGLFHITESDVFLVYDDTKDAFVTLGDTSQSCA